ncbi:unnamed protein product [Prunus brigantina]
MQLPEKLNLRLRLQPRLASMMMDRIILRLLTSRSFYFILLTSIAAQPHSKNGGGVIFVLKTVSLCATNNIVAMPKAADQKKKICYKAIPDNGKVIVVEELLPAMPILALL